MDEWRTSGSHEEYVMSTDDAFSAELDLEASADEERAIGQEEHWELSDRDMDALLVAIASSPEPNEAMLRSAERRREHGAPL
jgi:hypothetical protein